MNKQKFMELVVERVKETFEDREVMLNEVVKNNGIKLTGLVVYDKESNVGPAAYLDDAYRFVESGRMTFEEVVEHIIGGLKNAEPSTRESMDMSWFTQWESVKDKLCFRLVNREKNEEILKDAPHREFLDMEIIYAVFVDGGRLGRGTITVRGEHFDKWGVSEADLYEAAMENTPKLYPMQVHTMRDVLAEISGDIPEEAFAITMLILSNSFGTFGAAALAYPGVREEIAERVGGSYYVMPCSVHEVIILPAEGAEADVLSGLVNEANTTSVHPMEVLSFSVYRYDADKGEFKVFSRDQFANGDDDELEREA